MLSYNSRALAEAEEAGYKLGQARALSNSGYAYLFLGKHDNALKVYLLSQAIYQEIDDQDGKANITYSIGQGPGLAKLIASFFCSARASSVSARPFSGSFEQISLNSMFRVSARATGGNFLNT